MCAAANDAAVIQKRLATVILFVFAGIKLVGKERDSPTPPFDWKE